MSRSCPGDVPEMSRRCPGDVPESRRCPGDVPEISRRCPGDVPEMSRRRPRGSRMFPHMWLVSDSEDSCFFCFFSRFGPILLFLCFVLFFGVLSVNVNFGTEKNLSNSISFAKSIGFVYCSISSKYLLFHSCSALFCLFMFFTPFLGLIGLNFQGFEFSCRSCFFQQKLFSQTHVEANIFFVQTNVMRNIISLTENEMSHQGQHKNRTHCRPDRACKLHS